MKNDNKKPELLAPVGGVNQLHAAINFGADAVYLATNKFGMRAKAENFTLDQLEDAVNYAHSNNVKVYVAVNILMHDKEIAELTEYFKSLDDINVDACIISDLGAMAIAKKIAPNLDIHISTQMSIANSEAVNVLAEMGAKRIVLAREMSLKEIASLSSPLDIEAFVHGAMCMSVSGRCLISSYLTSRSANKGACTQPCRWGYSLLEEKRPGQKFPIEEDNYGTYIMNSKDMNMIFHLKELQEAGVSSFKIEGRNKKALYVATVVNAYRHVLDGEDPNKWTSELDKISHRPYSTGFYFGEAEQSPDYDGYEQECIHVGDVLEDGKILCRNRFEEGEELEALVPGEDVQKITIKNLTRNNKPEAVANRAEEIYEIDTKLKPGSLLRNNQYLRTSRK